VKLLFVTDLSHHPPPRCAGMQPVFQQSLMQLEYIYLAIARCCITPIYGNIVDLN